MNLKHITLALVGCLLQASITSLPAQASELPLEKLNLPAGFNISVFAKVKNARQLAAGPDGVFFTGSRRAGNIYAVIDKDRDHVAEKVITIDTDLNLPSGLTYRDGDLYVGAVDRILVYRDIVNTMTNSPEPDVLIGDLPSERHHGWKYIKFGPDGMLYVPVGAPCNICLSDDPRFASILRYDLETKDYDIYAHGVRNTVGFDWHPETGELWFTDNGRDWLGDYTPPCELNRVTAPGQHFGYPYVHGSDVIDPEFGNQAGNRKLIEPELNLGPHTAPLGMIFYTGTMFPPEFRNRALIAEHGSWNRSEEAGHIGYRITMAVENDSGKLVYETLIDGWLEDNVGWGRPVDLLQLEDGSILISDDGGNVIYRLTYNATAG